MTRAACCSSVKCEAPVTMIGAGILRGRTNPFIVQVPPPPRNYGAPQSIVKLGMRSTMSGNKNHSPRIPKGRAEIAKAGVDEHAGVSSSAPLTLVRANLPALNKKPQTHSASAKKVL